MNIKKAMAVFAASLVAASAFAQEQDGEEKEKEASEEPAATAEGTESAVKKAKAPGAVFTTLPFCRAVTGVAEVQKPGADAWEPVEEGRFYPLGSSYRTGKGGKLVLSFGTDSSAILEESSSFVTRLQPLGVASRGVVLGTGTLTLALADNLREGAFFVTAPGFTVKNPAGESRYVYETTGDGDKATVRCVTGALSVEGRHFNIPTMRAADEVVIRTSLDHLVTLLYGTSGDYVVKLDQGLRNKDDIDNEGKVHSSVEKGFTDWHLTPSTKVVITRCLPTIGERMSVHTMAFDASGERKSECYFCEGRAEVNSGELVAKDRRSGEELAKRAAEATETTAAEDADDDSASSSSSSSTDENSGSDSN